VGEDGCIKIEKEHAMSRKVCQNTSCHATGERVDQTDYCSEMCAPKMRIEKNGGACPPDSLSVQEIRHLAVEHGGNIDEWTTGEGEDRVARLKTKEKNASNSVTTGARFAPDWEQLWTKEEAEEQLQPFTFNGPGWYISKNNNGSIDTMLVIPENVNLVDPDGRLLDLFRHAWPAETRFWFSFYNERNPAALFCAIANAPTRLDER
jgi:hypothetical protein